MTKRINRVKQSIKVALLEVEIYSAIDWGMSEREFMRVLVETVSEIADNYVEIVSEMKDKYDPSHMQRCASGKK